MKEDRLRNIETDHDWWIDEDSRIVTKITKVNDPNYPLGFKIRCQFLCFKNDKWAEMVRVDNSIHGKEGYLHIHRFNKEKPEPIQLSIRDIEKFVIEEGIRLKKYL
ncbi:MAG: hypothetical protein AABX29_09260 [Nanoarchaeota archaeon]